MHFSAIAAGLFALFAAAASVDATAAHVPRAASHVQKGPAFPELQARYDPVSSNVRAATRTRRTFPQYDRNAWTRHRAVNILNGFQGNLGARAGTIKSLCGKARGQHNDDYYFKLSLQLKAELEALLAIVISAHSGIAGCGNGPQPSQTPGNPPSGNTIIIIIIQILEIFQACISVTIQLCQSNRIVRQNCAGVLTEISQHLYGFVASSHDVIGINVASSLGGRFALDGFGFGSLRHILQY